MRLMVWIRNFSLASLLVSVFALAGEPQTGPVVIDYGPVFAGPKGSFNLDPAQKYKVIMDVGKGPDDPAELNRSIDSAALSQAAHEKRFGVANRNSGLLEALGEAWVDIYLCGQTAGYYDYAPADLLPEVIMAVSAMTVHVRLQQQGYRAILF